MKTILSIDGGGIRGLIPALVLQRLEAISGIPTWASYDLIAGTSAGGLVALGLATNKMTAADAVALFKDRGKEIFHRRPFGGCLFSAKYGAGGLERILFDTFGNCKLASARTRVMVTTYDLESRRPLMIKSWKAEHRHIPLKSAARATSAAPTFFEPHLVQLADRQAPLIDGGVIANNPSLCALTEARRLWPDEKDIVVVSLGTGASDQPIDFRRAKGWGAAGWAMPVLDVLLDGTVEVADYQVRQILGPKYIRIQTRLEIANDAMDDASERNLQALKNEAISMMIKNTKLLGDIHNRIRRQAEGTRI